MADDVLLNKVAIVERCLGRIREEYADRERELETNQTRQDAIVLNYQKLSMAVVHSILSERLDDFTRFADAAMKLDLNDN